MKRIIACILIVLMVNPNAYSFCGFYVAKADAKIFNRGSQVILVRNGNKTTLTMSNDFQGDVKNFAMVVPVPVVLKETDVKIANQALFDQLDAYSGPRLVEYYDENPCYNYDRDYSYDMAPQSMSESVSNKSAGAKKSHDAYKVTIEAKYTVGEYDILVLSAKESTGLKSWLTDNGYKLPENAAGVLDPYIKSNLKFFVVKVNMEKFKSSGQQNLKPIQISYESPKFMLPIRLGMANSTGSQDLIVYAFTKTGRIECTNYRTVKIPSNKNIPMAVKSNFGKFYKSLFKKAYKNEGQNGVFLEYAWNVSPTWGQVKCDPCVGPPPITTQLTEAGVDWFGGDVKNVFFTRLHVRYTRDKFPQDLFFQVTPNTETFQARYIITNPAHGDFSCAQGQQYLRKLSAKRRGEVNELYALTGWNVEKYKTYIYEYNHLLGKQDVEDEEDGTYLIPSFDDNNIGKDKIYLTGLLLSVMLFSLLFNVKRRKNNVVIIK